MLSGYLKLYSKLVKLTIYFINKKGYRVDILLKLNLIKF